MEKIRKIHDELDNFPTYKPIRPAGQKSFSGSSAMTEDEVEKIVTGLATKNCELDTIPTALLKESLHEILPALTKLINLSLKQGIFIEHWKMAIIRPIIKKTGLELILKNFCPVSNLSFLSKLLECCALKKFSNHCDKEKLLPDYQSAYHPKYSCETALVKICNDILWSMESQRISALVALDLSAAFNMVDHEILLEVLDKQFGIQGKALSWFDSYPRPRGCKVKIGERYSTVRNLPYSVPQGSCAGPTLYFVYASTLQHVIEDMISLYGFANDHSIRKDFYSD